MIATSSRIAKAMQNMFNYLDGPQFCSSKAGANYIIRKLARKGLTAIVSKVDADGYWLVSTQYLGWTIFFGEQMWAERQGQNAVVLGS